MLPTVGRLVLKQVLGADCFLDGQIDEGVDSAQIRYYLLRNHLYVVKLYFFYTSFFPLLINSHKVNDISPTMLGIATKDKKNVA